MVGMNKLTSARRAQVVATLVEGNSIRATVHLTGAAKNTVVKLLMDLGSACARYQDRVMRDLPCQRLQCDEIWAFRYAKQKHVAPEKHGVLGYGDVWTWVALNADTKLVPAYLMGLRSAAYADAFTRDVGGRMRSRIQLTTDGHKLYLEAVEGAFGTDIDYAHLIKLYGSDPEDETRDSPDKCTGTETRIIQGNPDSARIATTYIERQNLTIRMSMRRFTRLTNAFIKKTESLEHAVALHFMWYNFGRVHKTLNTTPAVAADVTDHVWTMEEVVALLDLDEDQGRSN
jgi:IS1 family transposase